MAEMNEASWDAVAGDYAGRVLSVFDHDCEGLISGAIKEFAGPTRTASDIGCGVGKFLPTLAEQFKSVAAFDISCPLLSEAEETCAGHDNISYQRVDLGAGPVDLPKVHFALCVNMLLTPDLEQRMSMVDNIARQVRRGGHLLLVVPSMESAVYTNSRLIQWNLKEGSSFAGAEKDGFDEGEPTSPLAVRNGVLGTGGVPTKHFIKEEMQALLESVGYTLLRVQRLEYPWSTEFETPPKWMGPPFPWDWMFLARKR